jgi:hypothetical protein
MQVEFISTTKLAQRWGVKPVTIWRWRTTGLMPVPDVEMNGRVKWKISTVEAHEQKITLARVA